MSNLFEQYNEEVGKAPQTRDFKRKDVPEPIAAGYINARTEDDTPIFNKQRINFTPPSQVTHLVVNNNMLVIAMAKNIILRIDLERPENPDEVEVSRNTEDSIHQLFLDHNGRHLIISMESQDVLYLSRSSKKPRQLTKMKGLVIDSVAWNKASGSDNTTGEILLGSSKGGIFETEILSGEDSRFFQGSLEQYWKQLYNLGKDGAVPVTGLEVERVPAKSQTERKYFIMATTPGRLYQFIGIIPTSAEAPVFSYVFQNYEDNPASFLELPGNFGYSELKLYSLKHRASPQSFAWMTGPGVYYGNMDYSGQTRENVTSESRLLQYPLEEGEKFIPPKSMVVTEFHILLLFPDRLKAMCVLNEQLIYEDIYSKDSVKGTIWAYTDQSVFKYKVVREARDVWQMYLDKGDFERAKEYSKENPANMDKVLTKQAEHFFREKSYEKSAVFYALTERSFEEVALKFIQVDRKDALKTFLLKKLNGLHNHEKTQMTMITTWLIELYLNQLGTYKDQGDSNSYLILQEEFQKFLAHSRVIDCLKHHTATAYDLIASHGDVEDLVFFAVLMEDFERVISHHIQHDDYISALDVLKDQTQMELYYKFSPILMQHIPRETVDAWISQGRRLAPKRLIPALVHYDENRDTNKIHEAIRYLEFCVHTLSIEDEAIHNYLLSLYAKYQKDQLMKYLMFQGNNPDMVHYDLKYALRLCSEHTIERACVHIYTTMGLYEEAVDLALKVDVDLAKLNADRPEDDEELRKKLWLRIARHVVEEEKDIKRAMEFLHECDLLKIEDILPFFPDFVTIDHFKDAICTSLEEYNEHIEALKEEMNEATDSAKAIRSDIQEMRNKFGVVTAQQKCSACTFPLLTRGFYLYPCQHMFHADCLIAEVMPNLSASKRHKVEELQRKLASGQYTYNTDSPAKPTSAVAHSDVLTKQDQKNQVKLELDDIIAAECVYCGEMMIRSIDRPFLDSDEYSEGLSAAAQ
uniref:Vacuolar protein sorting-associated protein 18 homolog n=1 Tax=Saccoglossus kowalevskii TaxID=10224 RepID=A0ABM0LVU9_SACKO|nr:PREDICTED: vacuolar protein sorting-associated protein 18 homolog [Saccoglossus kowalevskii]